eukprot:TRINITY_DN95329_c0_g1_i1.p1 TRINITY_DN95329_c0_g1~~TRINITY_DN95329_c0_g1_i1.p1  ORF type:complete len:401 (+),score=179.51 TRINITY_DN95329_c0_g1_i1:1-1203(+)
MRRAWPFALAGVIGSSAATAVLSSQSSSASSASASAALFSSASASSGEGLRIAMMERHEIDRQLFALDRRFGSGAVVSQYNANAKCEDTYAVDAESGLYGVFDGHSGRAASYFCRDHMLRYIRDSAAKRRAQLQGSYDFVSAFLQLDNDFLTGALRENRVKDGLAGACALVVHVDEAKGVITTANAGDCRAIVARKVGDGQYKAVPLSIDHDLNNPNERHRLTSEHPDEPDVLGRPSDPRVKGMLQPSRGIGDGKYKMMEFWESLDEWVRMRFRVWKPPYTTAHPEVRQHRIVPGQDEFIVMATDGLYIDFDSQQVADLIGQYTQLDADAQREVSASGFLMRETLLHASRRSFGVLQTPEENLSVILKLPSKLKRRVYDDITVLVIPIDQSKVPNKQSKL